MPAHARNLTTIALTCVMAVLLCLAQTASGVATRSLEKTASGIFFADPNIYTGEILPESQQPQWEIAPTATPTASGRQVWPSADPIGEAGGMNLYGYVGNDPINGWDPLGLRGYPSDFIGPLQPDDYYIPEGPPGADVKANCDAAKKMINPWTFKGMVKNKGPWDYKQKGRQYENFGNYNYGATGNAFGLSLNTLHNEAGRAQSSAGTSNPAYGKPAPRWKMFLGCDGTGSRGDDPNDQLWIKRGFDWYQGQRPPPAPFVPVIPTGY